MIFFKKISSLFSLDSSNNNLFNLLLLLYLSPIWFFKYFPTHDGPLHLYNAKILYNLIFLPNESFYHSLYEINNTFPPNLISHILLVFFMLFFSPITAEKVLLSIYVILFPLSFRYCVRSISPQNDFISFFIFPFVFNFFLFMGFYNFILSMALYFVILGFWFRCCQNFTINKIFGFWVLSLLLFYCHIQSIMMIYITIGTFIIWSLLIQDNNAFNNNKIILRSGFKKKIIVYTAISFLPSIFLTLLFLYRQGKGNIVQATFMQKMTLFLSNASIISISQNDWLFSLALSTFFIFLFINIIRNKIRLQIFNVWDAFLHVIIIYFALLLMMPLERSGGGFITHRIIIYIFLTLIIWFGGQAIDLKLQIISKYIILLIVIGSLTSNIIHVVKINNYFKEYLSGINFIEPNATLYSISFWERYEGIDGNKILYRINFFYHAGGYVAALREGININNYEARMGYFPVIYKPQAYINNYIGDSDKRRFKLNLEKYQEKTRNHIDYLLIWGVDSASEKEAEDLKLQLKNTQYQLGYTSPQHGYMKVYQKRKEVFR